MDPRLVSVWHRMKAFMNRTFGDEKLTRINDSQLVNSWGIIICADYLTKLDKVDKLRSQFHRRFEFKDSVISNNSKMLLGWLEAFSFQMSSLAKT